MKLTDLDPRWLAELGRDRQGLTFLCPHCKALRLAVVFSNPVDGGSPLPDFNGPGMKRLAELLWAGDMKGKDIVPPGYHWTREGETFETLTLSPSVDCSRAGHWHGWLAAGECR